MKKLLLFLLVFGITCNALGQVKDTVVTSKTSPISASVGICNILPISVFDFLVWGFNGNIGYEVNTHWNVQFCFEATSPFMLIPSNSQYVDFSPNISTFQLDIQFKIYKDIYFSSSSGLAYLWTDSLHVKNNISHDTTSTPGFTKNMFWQSFSLGVSTTHFFSDFKYSFGLPKIIFPNGEKWRFLELGFRIGYIFRF
jgi:hypothetical protein